MIPPTDKLGRVFVDQIVRRDCYGLRSFTGGLGLRPTPPADTAIAVLDVGANAGFFAVFARMLLPYAAITSVEPCETTLALLRRNTYYFAVRAVGAALGPSGTTARVVAGRDAGSNYTVDAADGVPAYTLAQLMTLYCRAAVRVVKIDCEGGEHVVIDSADETQALLQADHVAMETHWQCSKWPHATPKDAGMKWVSSFMDRWHQAHGELASATYKDTGRGGLLICTR